jgi:hypothetical protein
VRPILLHDLHLTGQEGALATALKSLY